MDSGLTKLFLRKRSKRPVIISEPLRDTFQQTAGYKEFHDGKPPTIGTRPIKPSDEKKGRKSFSHLRAKSTGVPEFSRQINQGSGARPRTAQGISPPATETSAPSRPRVHNRTVSDQPPMRREASQAPEIPSLPNHKAGMKRPKYFDLLQATVPTSTAKPLPKSTTGSSDMYNESVADRNSQYSKPLKSAPSNDLRRPPSATRDKHALARENVDQQRATFDVIRASRNFNATVSQAATESTGKNIPGSSAFRGANHSGRSPSKSVRRERMVMSEKEKSDGFAQQLASKDSHRLKRKEVNQTASPAQSSPNAKGNLSSTLSASDPPSSLPGTGHHSGRRRSTTAPKIPTPRSLTEESQVERPVIVISNPIQHVSRQMKGTRDDPVPFTIPTRSNSQGSITTGVQTSGYPPPSFSPNGELPLVGADGSERGRENSKRRSRYLSTASINMMPDDVPKVNSSVRKGQIPSKSVTRVSESGRGRTPSAKDESKNDVEAENGMAHPTDHTALLRSAVVSASSYVHRFTDDVAVGRILQHRRSRDVSQDKSSGRVPSDREVSVSSRSDRGTGTSTPRGATSLMHSDSSDSASQKPAERTKERGSSSRPAQRPSHRALNTTTVREPSTAPAAANHTLSGHGVPESRPHAMGNLRNLRPGTGQPSAKTSATSETPLPTKSPPSGKPPPAHGGQETARFIPPTVTRDFALPQRQPHAITPAPANRLQPGTNDSIDRAVDEGNQGFRLGGYIHIDRAELGSGISEMDRIIATKKQAAAKALLKLQEVMAMPMWEKEPNFDSPRSSTTTTTTTTPNYSRCLSLDNGRPIPPRAIFNQVKIPPPASRLRHHHVAEPSSSSSSFLPRGYEAAAPGPDGELNQPANGGDVANALVSSLQQTSWDDAARQKENIEPFGSLDPPPLRLGKRGRSDSESAVLVVKRGHSRMGSGLSMSSSTSAHSLPYYLVPARGSSRRDEYRDGVDGDDGGGFGEPSSRRMHVGELAWR